MASLTDGIAILSNVFSYFFFFCQGHLIPPPRIPLSLGSKFRSSIPGFCIFAISWSQLCHAFDPSPRTALSDGTLPRFLHRGWRGQTGKSVRPPPPPQGGGPPKGSAGAARWLPSTPSSAARPGRGAHVAYLLVYFLNVVYFLDVCFSSNVRISSFQVCFHLKR